ncbi:MAG TPA: glycosyltransferase family 2 protein [Verrucomicrobiae bacterium]|nr:glycosyltransferase family 2 protein [Verrucomicrobiae bacterium]
MPTAPDTLLSVIIPCFNEEAVLWDTYRRLTSVLEGRTEFHHELIFVDDGSLDSTPHILQEIARRDPRAVVVRFSRNFGHQPAVSAGLRRCHGELAVIIDADLQDPPEVIPDMVCQLAQTGSNVVYGVRNRRKGETLFKRVTASLYYQLLSKLSDVPLPVNAGDFRLIDRKIINAFNSLQENNKYIRGLISWMGFKQTPFYYDRDPRYAGETKYSLRKMLRFASTGVFYFSKKPLQIATTFGFSSVAAGLVLSLWVLINKLISPQYIVSGWTSIILLTIYFGGVQLLTIGILGQYIGSLFDEVKRRPEYIVDEPLRVTSDETQQPASAISPRLRSSPDLVQRPLTSKEVAARHPQVVGRQ